MEPKRRLPVIQTPEEGDGAPVRPAWQWVGFGALAILAVWLPLAWVLGTAATRLNAVAQLGALGVASWAGGFLVGRWGTEKIGLREAIFAALATTGFATAVSLLLYGGGIGSALVELLAMAIVALPAAAMGGARGLRRRRAT
jgi:hypothetical protein